MGLLESYSDNKEAQDAIRLVKYTNHSVFLTGKAGTGKSTLLRTLVGNINKNFVIIAPTGIAALNVGGQTIHSFFQLEPRPYLPNDRDLKSLTRKKDILEKLELIVIDEVSMVRADLLNAVDLSLRQNLKINKPFAGKQLLFIGDLFQLPPVVDSRRVQEVEMLMHNYSTPYFFSSKALEYGLKYYLIELKKVYRQKDENFISILNSVRENRATQQEIFELNKRFIPHYKPTEKTFEIVLATTNEIVRNLNDSQLDKLPGEPFRNYAERTGVFQSETNDSKLPADKVLLLKPGAQVMFIKNDSEKRWVNGSLGKVISISSNSLRIQLDQNKETHNVNKVKWENYEYQWDKEEEKIKKIINGTFTQFPLKLAWAVTIHKSQGQTFENTIIDMGNGAFTTGQTYVALSRCVSLNGIKLKRPIAPTDIKTDERIIQYMQSKSTNGMEREMYERIAEGMQQTLNVVEPLNIKLKSDLNVAKKLHSDVERRMNVLGNDNARLSKENDALKDKLNSKSTIITWLVVICIVLVLVIYNMN